MSESRQKSVIVKKEIILINKNKYGGKKKDKDEDTTVIFFCRIEQKTKSISGLEGSLTDIKYRKIVGGLYITSLLPLGSEKRYFL